MQVDLEIPNKEMYLGETPTNINKENFMNYFLYVYEFNWTSECFSKIQDIELFFTKKLDELEEKLECELSVEKKWWALTLLSLNEYAKYDELIYSLNVIESIFNKFKILSVQEIELYVNLINSSQYGELPEVLSVRPLAIRDINSNITHGDKEFERMLDNSDRFIKIFKKNLLQRDIFKDYLSQILVNKRKTNKEFTGFWESYFEIYLGFILTLTDMLDAPIKEISKNYREDILGISSVFLISSIENKEKIDKLNEELSEVLYSCLIEN